MAEKKTPANKSLKTKPATKKAAPKTAAIDWDKVSDPCHLVATGTSQHMPKGKVFPRVPKETAKLLVNKGAATLK